MSLQEPDRMKKGETANRELQSSFARLDRVLKCLCGIVDDELFSTWLSLSPRQNIASPSLLYRSDKLHSVNPSVHTFTALDPHPAAYRESTSIFPSYSIGKTKVSPRQLLLMNRYLVKQTSEILISHSLWP